MNPWFFKNNLYRYGVWFAVIIIIFILGIMIGQVSNNQKNDSKDHNKLLELGDTKKVTSTILALDSYGNGVAAKLVTEIRKGNGLVLVNVNDILADVNAQYSARLAKIVTENLTGLKLDNTDVIFNILTDASIVGGQSAGGVMALSLLSLVTNNTINNSVMATGAIDSNGTFVSVDGVLEKSKAAKKEGGKMVLVPIGNSGDVSEYNKIRKCGEIDVKKFVGIDFDGKEYCETIFEERKINIGRELNIDVVEVSNIQEAEKYYFI
ncbi:MAG: S16 family serine protease [Nanoarchaeota archaeon]|nr:S16 family serine protease [Nanoarchaeota archaeon]